MPSLRAYSICLLALGAGIAVAHPAAASDAAYHRGKTSERRHHEDVRAAVERGDIKPLFEVLRAVQPKLPGQIVGVEAEFEGGLWVYEFRVIDAKGRLYEVYVDAATADVTKIKEK
ncbi:MAG: PepSY domain-containing protein [Hyphomicrobium sp.]